MFRPNADQCIDASLSAIACLTDRFLYEHLLFRTSASLTDVKILQTAMCQGDFARARDYTDPHVLTGVLTTSLQQIPDSLLSEVYDEVVSMDITEDYSQCRVLITSWLVKLSLKRFELVKALLNFLHLLSNLPGSDSNATQLSFVISPLICRPANSAHMSIRHQEALRRIRPVLGLLIEHYPEIFTKDLKPRVAAISISLPTVASTTSKISQSLPIRHTGTNQISTKEISTFGRRSTLAPSILIPTPDYTPSSKFSSPLRVSVPSHDMLDDFAGEGFAVMDNGESSPNDSHAIKFVGWEWKMLESIVSSRVDFHIRYGCSGLNFNSIKDNNFMPDGSRNFNSKTSSDHSYKGKSNTDIPMDPGGYQDQDNKHSDDFIDGSQRTRQKRSNVNAEEKRDNSPIIQSIDSSNIMAPRGMSGGFTRPGTPQLTVAEIQRMENMRDRNGPRSSSGNIGGKAIVTGTSGSIGIRRRMVAQCKSLKTQITEFEMERQRVCGSKPKTVQERAPLQSVYASYRDMKRNIRDLAAIDMQRCARGFITRRFLLKKYPHNHQLSASTVSNITSTYHRSPNASNTNNSNNDSRNNSTSYYQQDSRNNKRQQDLFSIEQSDKNINHDGLDLSRSGTSSIRSAVNSNNDPGGYISTGEDGDYFADVQHSNSSEYSIGASHAGSNGGNKSLYPLMEAASGGGGVKMGGDTTATLQTSNAIPPEVYGKYRELLEEKRELKRLLKRFDEEFTEKHGRAPRKADKEVMRPKYQRYHETKGILEEMRLTIEASHGPLLPDELLMAEEVGATLGGADGNVHNSGTKAGIGPGIVGTESGGFAMDRTQSFQRPSPLVNNNTNLVLSSSADSATLKSNNSNNVIGSNRRQPQQFNSGPLLNYPVGAAGVLGTSIGSGSGVNINASHVTTGSPPPTDNSFSQTWPLQGSSTGSRLNAVGTEPGNDQQMQQLNEEKKALHAYLKEFERYRSSGIQVIQILPNI